MNDRNTRKIELAKTIIGISTSQLANLAGVAASTLSRQLSGAATSELKTATIEKMDAAVRDHIASGKATEDQIDLYQEEYLALTPGATMPQIAGPAQEVAYSPAAPARPLEAFHAGPMDIPVKGTAAGSMVGAMQISPETVEFVRRPPSLASAKNAFAIYVIGESMTPQHNPGELRYVHPDRPPASGDSVIIETYNPSTRQKEAFIKIFDRRDGNRIICHQHNPNATIEYIIPTGDVPEKTDRYAINVYKVLTLNELLGF